MRGWKKWGPESLCALLFTRRHRHQKNAGCVRGEEDHVNTAPPLPLEGSHEGALQMTKLLIAGAEYYDRLMTFDTRIRWLKKWKMCRQLSEEWCSKEPNKATGLMRSQLSLWAASLTLNTRIHFLPTKAADPQQPPTSNTKIHTSAKHTQLFFTSTVKVVRYIFYCRSGEEQF